jgi:hypothetical protein
MHCSCRLHCDNNWYTDSDATDHITGELNKLTMYDAYNGTDQIHVANGTGMEITNVGTSIIPTPRRKLVLNNVLHVPATTKNLISIHKFTLDNDMFIEYYQFYFLIKEQKMRKVLLHGPYKGALYPLPPLTSKFQKLIYSAIHFSIDHWHNYLGHPAHDIVLYVIRDNNLSCSSFEIISSVCDPSLRAKGRQLPYPVSSSRVVAPLELIHCYVWGPVIQSFGHKNTMSILSMIIANSHKSICCTANMKFFNTFLSFQSLVNYYGLVSLRGGGVEYEHLNSFFRQVSISHHVSCLHTHQQIV